MILGCCDCKPSTQNALLIFAAGVLANIVFPRRSPDGWRRWKWPVRLGTVILPIAITTLGQCFDNDPTKMKDDDLANLDIDTLTDEQIGLIRNDPWKISSWKPLLEGKTPEQVVNFVDRLACENRWLFWHASVEQKAALIDRWPERERLLSDVPQEVALYVKTVPGMRKVDFIDHLSFLWSTIKTWDEGRQKAWLTLARQADKDIFRSAHRWYYTYDEAHFDRTFGQVYLQGRAIEEIYDKEKLVVQSYARVSGWNTSTSRPEGLTAHQLHLISEFIPAIASAWAIEMLDGNDSALLTDIACKGNSKQIQALLDKDPEYIRGLSEEQIDEIALIWEQDPKAHFARYRPLGVAVQYAFLTKVNWKPDPPLSLSESLDLLPYYGTVTKVMIWSRELFRKATVADWEAQFERNPDFKHVLIVPKPPALQQVLEARKEKTTEVTDG